MARSIIADTDVLQLMLEWDSHQEEAHPNHYSIDYQRQRRSFSGLLKGKKIEREHAASFHLCVRYETHTDIRA